jgi:hypothetical protein
VLCRKMFDLTLAALVLTVPHVALMYAAANVWNLDYKTVLLYNGVTALISTILAGLISPAWKAKAEAAINREKAAGDLGEDLLGAFAVIVAGAVASNMIVSRRYGMKGWLGLVAENTVLGFLF